MKKQMPAMANSITPSGVAILNESQKKYAAMSQPAISGGIIEPGKGFELKGGLNVHSSGPALPISRGPDAGELEPKSDGAADDSDEDEGMIEEPSGGQIPDGQAEKASSGYGNGGSSSY